MAAALRLAAKGLGRVWPNPSVGCVLVKDGQIIGSGWTGDGGRPHAEKEALQMASGAVMGATAYVTLEPCAHEGETPSCARLLAEAGVERVIYAVEDPDPRTSGKGAENLKKAGVQVEERLMAKEASALNRGFYLSQTQNRPLVTMKVATSADGKIAAAEGVRTQITGPETQKFSHHLRAIHDAILVGIGTVLVDDPDLTCRIPGSEDASPVRIVLDTNLRIPLDSRLVNSAKEVPVWVVTEQQTIPPKLSEKGVEIISVKDIKDMKEVFEKIAQKGITRLLTEGGAGINESLLKSHLVDAVLWMKAPGVTLGQEGVSAVRGNYIKSTEDLTNFIKVSEKKLGQDVVEILERLD